MTRSRGVYAKEEPIINEKHRKPIALPDTVVALWLELSLAGATTLKKMAFVAGVDYTEVLKAIERRFKKTQAKSHGGGRPKKAA